MGKKWLVYLILVALLLGGAGAGVALLIARYKDPIAKPEPGQQPAEKPDEATPIAPPIDAPAETAAAGADDAQPPADASQALPAAIKELPPNVREWADAIPPDQLPEVKDRLTKRIESDERVIQMLEKDGYDDKAADRRGQLKDLHLKLRAVELYIQLKGDGRPVEFPW